MWEPGIYVGMVVGAGTLANAQAFQVQGVTFFCVDLEHGAKTYRLKRFSEFVRMAIRLVYFSASNNL